MELKVRVNRKDIYVKGKSTELAAFVKQLFGTQEQLQTLQTTDANLPTVAQIVAFLEELPNFQHSMPTIMDKFYRRLIDARKERCLYDQLYRRVESARKFIESKYNGKFEGKKVTDINGYDRAKRITLYVFQREKVETAK